LRDSNQPPREPLSELADAGQYHEALATTERALERLSATVPPDALPRVNAAANRARVLLAAGRSDEARALLEAVEAELDGDHPLRAAISGLLEEAVAVTSEGE
jgi:thioredoxin-like negative regulator of GroEL